MNRQKLKVRIEEFSRIRNKPVPDRPSLAETAMFVEDVFGLTLTDEEISERNLGSIAAIEDFVLKKLESNH